MHDNFLDMLLKGELPCGELTYIYGGPSTGKTNISLIGAVRAAEKKDGCVVMYIDTEGGFSVERIKQIAVKDVEKVLNHIRIAHIYSFDELKITVDRIEDFISSGKISLVIVDSIGAPYRLEENKDPKTLGRIVAKLLRIAKKYNVPVLITNHVYTDFDTKEQIPVGGDIIQYWAKISVELIRVRNAPERIAILRRHKFLEENASLRFRITDSGIICSEIHGANDSANLQKG